MSPMQVNEIWLLQHKKVLLELVRKSILRDFEIFHDNNLYLRIIFVNTIIEPKKVQYI